MIQIFKQKNEKTEVNEKKRKPQIVVVDSDTDLLDMLDYAFEAHGYEIKSFTRGKEAYNYFSDKRNGAATDLVIIERLLPDMDGIELIKFIQEKYPKDEAPLLLILSMLEGEKDMLEGLEAGAVEYVTKPFSLAVLFDEVQALLMRYRK